VTLFSDIPPPAGSHELIQALCEQQGARAARWMRTEFVGEPVEGVVVSPDRVEVFAIAGVEIATVAYAWKEPPPAGGESGRIITVLGLLGIDSALAAVRACRSRRGA
jgi:hypothetical protein